MKFMNKDEEQKRLAVGFLGINLKSQLPYFRIIGLISFCITLICFLIFYYFYPDYFYQKGLFSDLKLANNAKNGIFESVIYLKEVSAEIVKPILRNKIIDSSIVILESFFGVFIFFYFITIFFFSEFIKEISKNINEDKILSGTEVLENENYLDKLKELGQENPIRSIKLTGIYRRKTIKVLEDDNEIENWRREKK